MNDNRGEPGAPPERPLGLALLDQLRLAISFLTIIPVLGCDSSGSEDLAASFGWFPLVGFVLGAILAFADFCLRRYVRPAARAALIVIALAVVTGGVHLDGLADTADALGAGRDRTRALEILQDSRLGTFGGMALFFVLILKLSALAGAVHAGRYQAIFLAPGLGRWAMVMTAQGMTYLRAEGAGSTLLRSRGARNWWVATLISTIAVNLTRGTSGWLAAGLAVLLSLALRAFYRRWLGGVTGDLIGAAGEIVETAVLLAVAN